MENKESFLCRSEALIGEEGMTRLNTLKVIIFGLGGVGSWCAEALVRSGVQHLTLVDSDVVDPTNINRQLPALHSSIGSPKVQVLRERFLDINPQANIIARQERFSAESAASFLLEDYDYVIDAIDSVADKLDLILSTTLYPHPTLLSSMGAARKLDPLQVRVSEFWKVDGCPLAATLRKRMRRTGRFPQKKFKCVWSPERIDTSLPKGTMMPVTATFGLTLASLVIKPQR